MYILCFAIISHERPSSLRRMLHSLINVARSSQVQVIVSDNSVIHADAVRAVCDDSLFVLLYSTPGISQFQNYEQALSYSDARYISFLHDDDFLFLTPTTIEQTIEQLSSVKWPSLFYSRSVSFSPSTPPFLYSHRSNLPKPYSMGAFPFNLPVFPCWVYPCTPDLKHRISCSIGSRPFGKYSDILLLEDLLQSYDYTASVLPYYYLHVQHATSDSSSTDYHARIKLMLHTFYQLSPGQLLPFMIASVNHSLSLLLRRLHAIIVY
jgi:hypothetical protein